MKKTLLFLCLTVSFGLLFLPRASTQENMRVNLKDGSVIEVAIDDIRKLTFDLSTDLQQPGEIIQQLLKIKAYPNPAREFVNVDYTLASQGDVFLEVYGINGNLVLKMNFGDQQAGEYQYRWSTADVPSGIYICRIRHNTEIVSEKIIIKK
ncbi:MAG: T9SS type A sorting domain-containing protein [Bacteroidales bacterium]|nr:T9SS type A sorting domain-containing protein [Lentimicrobiaceae bacterium]MDD5696311.1 T9SS type A sorting domain-containing protein [Bacteroidales bacterium]